MKTVHFQNGNNHEGGTNEEKNMGLATNDSRGVDSAGCPADRPGHHQFQSARLVEVGVVKMNIVDLKPCPFCGGEAAMIVHAFALFDTGISHVGGEPSEVKITCRYCGAGTGVRWNKDEAVNAWNRRVTDGTD